MKMRSVAVLYFVFVFYVPSMVLGIQRVLIRVSFKLKQEIKTMIFFNKVIQIYCFFFKSSVAIYAPGFTSHSWTRNHI